MEDETSLITIFFLLLMSAFFSGSETALTASSQPLMHRLELGGDKRAAVVNRLYEQKERLIGAILLGNNLVNILASSLATSLLITYFGEAGVAYATLAMTLLVLIFAEVMPKTYAIKNANTMALAVSGPIRVLVALLSPITHTIELIVRYLFRAFGIDIRASDDSEHEPEEELRGAIELHTGNEETGLERTMLRSVLDLADVQVGEIMVHRSGLGTLSVDIPVDDIVAGVLESPYTRIPLWQEEPDNIVGVLHAKALFRAVKGAGDEDLSGLDIKAMAAEPWFIPETTPLLDQLEAFRERREHFALVVDEYGSLQGIVTLEDIIEEIVGEIDDEHDLSVAGVEPQADGSFMVDGTVTIRDLNREYEWGLPDEEAATVAGLVLHEARRIPDVGQSFRLFGFRFDIVTRQRHQITRVRITPPKPGEITD
ncbi:MAG: HlyC/CorC family transporter [Rhodospirillales bacterium]